MFTLVNLSCVFALSPRSYPWFTVFIFTLLSSLSFAPPPPDWARSMEKVHLSCRISCSAERSVSAD